MKTASTTLALISLIAANLVPLYGVTTWGWSVFSILLVYWAESAVIGFFTIKKMLRVDQFIFVDKTTPSKSANDRAKLFFIPFFMLHFGLFMLVHLVFLVGFFGSTNVSVNGILLSILSLVMSHWISYQGNFIGQKEYERTTLDAELFKPYGRIIVMHLTVILGGILTMTMGQSILGLVVLIGVKTVVDLIAHVIQHRAYQVVLST
jgi:hypothetical protein